MKYLKVLLFGIMLTGCHGQQLSIPIDQHNIDSSKLPVQNKIIVEALTNDSTLKLISGFSEMEFKNSRKSLINEGSEYKYQISEIRNLNGILKYEASIPGINCQIEYTCEPEKGDLMMTMLGDKDLARFYYDQSKAVKTWQDCHSLDNTEHCSSYENIKGYPLKMQLTISLVNYDTTSIYTLHRVIMPK